MKKLILIAGLLMLWASGAGAQQAGGDRQAAAPEFRISGGWYGAHLDGNNIAGEYEYLKSSASGALNLEWDPLPHRFVLESYFLNPKDYFGEVDYSYRDVFVLNAYTRGLFHNLNHYSFGLDDPTTAMPTFTDLNPGDFYGIENSLRRGFVRLKTPDFPLHIYADVRTIERDGTIQQRFLSGNLNKISQSRDIDWNTTDFRVGANAHLGPIEADYSHTEKKFEAERDKVMFDPTSGIAHNLVPDFTSSFDTVKLHTSYSGKFVLSGTYTNGDKKNEDSDARVAYTNAAGDLMVMPVTSLILTVKYRHYDLDVTNPDTITLAGFGTVNVRDSISSNRDVVSAVLRYRVTDRLVVKGEYVADTIDRTRGTLNSTLIVSAATGTGPAFWLLPESTTKNTARAGFTYRIMRKMMFRADYSQTNVVNPAYETDPDKSSTARAALTWMPTPGFNTMLSYSMLRETRDDLSAPLGGGSRDAARDQGLASATMLIGRRSSLTASYAYYNNKVEQTLSYEDGTGVLLLEPDVPYDDIAHTGSLSLTVAPAEGVNLIAGVDRSYLRGTLDISGSVPGTNGIAQLSNLKAVETGYTAGIEMQHTRYASSEVRYQYRHYDDQLDNTQDGTFRLVLATLSLKW